MKRAALLALAAASMALAQFPEVFITPYGIWDACWATGNNGGRSCSQPTTPYLLLQVKTINPDTAGFIYTVTGHDARGRAKSMTGYMPYNAPDQYGYSSIVLYRQRMYEPVATVVEVATEVAQ